jgi:hypothetical protein
MLTIGNRQEPQAPAAVFAQPGMIAVNLPPLCSNTEKELVP